MKLAIDIGNTAITLGVFKNSELIQKENFKDYNDAIDFLNTQNSYSFNSIIISSVVPEVSKTMDKILFDLFNLTPIYITHELSKLVLNVKHPDTVGADRLCNIVAANNLYSSPSIVIDFGTATTYDVINSSGHFLGGAIAPGIETSALYLIEKAALLDRTDLLFPNKVIGVDTKENIQSGIMFGAIDQITGMIQRIKQEQPDEYIIILTGGFSKILSPYLSNQHILDIDLTLKGMILIDELSS